MNSPTQPLKFARRHPYPEGVGIDASYASPAPELDMALAWQSSAWVDVSDEQGAVVLRVGGELDESSRGAVEPAIMAAVQSATSVILDLRSLTFCDSSGVALFLCGAEIARRRSCSIAIDHATPAVRRILEIAAIGEVIQVRD